MDKKWEQMRDLAQQDLTQLISAENLTGILGDGAAVLGLL